MSPGTKAILLDIEGTTSPVAFVYEVLFPYARYKLESFLIQNWERPDVREDIALLVQELASEGMPPPDDSSSAVRALLRFMDEDRKSTSLKSIQGKVWEAGFNGGVLKSSFFDDVPPALARWRAGGFKVAIYSSGSVQAQKLLFSHAESGDLTGNISAWFDTRSGAKTEAESYSRIASGLGFNEPTVLFISDNPKELDAAVKAGMDVLLAIRPGNAPISDPSRFQSITSFDQVSLNSRPRPKLR
jgi:enolase-phosphatase E1